MTGRLCHTAATQTMTRRRFITVAAAFAGACATDAPRAAAAPASTYTWRGVMLGAQASLTLQHKDEAAARAAIAACLTEVARLEAIFSLHRADSAIVRLNGDGRLDGAPADLRRLLSEALWLAEQTQGRFDPSIQPLWQCYAEHFASPHADPDGPSAEAIARARKLVHWRDVKIVGSAIVLAQPGMALTLNGMAQGYITDRVGDLLRASGFTNVLVNMGEQLALGPKWTGESWTIEIANPSDPAHPLAAFRITSGAVATSSFTGFAFDAQHRFTHILDARSGQPAQAWTSVSVLADSAARADGLSTAIAASPAGIVWRPILGSARVLVQAREDEAAVWLT